ARPKATTGCTNRNGMGSASRSSKTVPASVSILATALTTPIGCRVVVDAFGKLPTQSAILDGELVLIDPRGAAHCYRLMAQMRTSHPDESPVNVHSLRSAALR
ncbi:MAG TPA: hypothetical protein VFP79_10360, partial [Pseudolabrys sp.]|nr:hypothetical protein [Pseudolabrys sp.]